MNKLLVFIFIATTFFTQDLVISQESTPTGKVVGKVFNKKSNKPISGTEIFIPKEYQPKKKNRWSMKLRTYSKKDGSYELRLPKGLYKIYFSHLAYNGFQSKKIEIKTDSTTIQNAYLTQPEKIMK